MIVATTSPASRPSAVQWLRRRLAERRETGFALALLVVLLAVNVLLNPARFCAGRVGDHRRPRRAAGRGIDRCDARDPWRPRRHRCLHRAAHGVGQRADRADADRRRGNLVPMGRGSGGADCGSRRGRAQRIPRRVCPDSAHRRDAWNLSSLHRPHPHDRARSYRNRAPLDPESVGAAVDRASCSPLP